MAHFQSYIIGKKLNPTGALLTTTVIKYKPSTHLHKIETFSPHKQDPIKHVFSCKLSNHFNYLYKFPAIKKYKTRWLISKLANKTACITQAEHRVQMAKSGFTRAHK